MRSILILTIILSMGLMSMSVAPTWTSYPNSIMFSGQHRTFAALTQPSLTPYNFKEQIYFVAVGNYYTFTSTDTPRVILSLEGYQQSAPADTNTFVGWTVSVQNVTKSRFDVQYTIIGASMGYLSYMYFAVTSTDYWVGEYTQFFDQNAQFKAYTFDIANKAGENYATFGYNKIVQKGFLAGYKMKQGLSPGISLNFTLQPKNATFFTIIVETYNTAVLDSICYYRIGYDQTAIEQRDKTSVFRDFYYESVNGANTRTASNAGFKTAAGFNYRNYLMGTNKIMINGSLPMAIQFYLEYAFYSDKTMSAPSTANYLYGQTFHHKIQSCGSGTFYVPAEQECLATCPDRYFADSVSKTCLPCHYSCLTCSVQYAADKCLTCDTDLRKFNTVTKKCQCLAPSYDNGKTLLCSWYSTDCQNFNANNKCIACSKGYLLTFENSCINAVSYCAFYDTSRRQCTSCVGSYQLQTSNGAQTCVLLPQNCSQTVSGTCVKCISGFVNANGACIPQQTIIVNPTCGENEYVDSKGNCAKNTDPNCKTFASTGECIECKEKYEVNVDTKLCTEKAIKNFTKCAQNTPNARWIIIEDKCVKIDTKCAEEGFSVNGCFNCEPGYYIFEKVCYKLSTIADTISQNTNQNTNEASTTGTGSSSNDEVVFDHNLGDFVVKN